MRFSIVHLPNDEYAVKDKKGNYIDWFASFEALTKWLTQFIKKEKNV